MGKASRTKVDATRREKIAAQRAPELPAKRPSPVRAMIEPRIRWTQPQVLMSARMAPWPPTMTMSLLRTAAKPQRASSDPTMKSRQPAK
jgi:hypothetical protein